MSTTVSDTTTGQGSGYAQQQCACSGRENPIIQRCQNAERDGHGQSKTAEQDSTAPCKDFADRFLPAADPKIISIGIFEAQSTSWDQRIGYKPIQHRHVLFKVLPITPCHVLAAIRPQKT